MESIHFLSVLIEAHENVNFLVESSDLCNIRMPSVHIGLRYKLRHSDSFRI